MLQDGRDNNKRKKAIEAMQKRFTDTGKHTAGQVLSKIYKARKQGRKHKSLHYPVGACKWCIAWGWDPKHSKHPDTVCIYIKNGPLHKKLGGTYENMYSSKLTSNFFQMRSQVFAERRAEKAKKKKVKFSGKTQRVPDDSDTEDVRNIDAVERVPDEHTAERVRDCNQLVRIPNSVESEVSAAAVAPAQKAEASRRKATPTKRTSAAAHAKKADPKPTPKANAKEASASASATAPETPVSVEEAEDEDDFNFSDND